MTEFTPAEVFHPGEYLRDELEARGWKDTELAERTRLPVSLLRFIMREKASITPDTAYAISEAFGQSANLWMHLQETYDRWKSPT
jgi:HTH-type transcriptional regulator/antitoxin HigA